MRTRPAPWWRSTRWAASAPPSPHRLAKRPPTVHAVTLPDDDAIGGGGKAPAGRSGNHLRARADLRQRRGGGRRSGIVRLPGGDEDPVARHSAQVGDRRRAAGCRPTMRRCATATTCCWRVRNAPRPNARIEGVLVAKQLQGGVECILGIHRDPVFGPIAMFGLGGIFVEVMKDVVFRRCPFGADVAEQMIRSIKGAPLLLGARGRPKADVRGAGADAGAAVGLRRRGGAAAAIDRSEPGVRNAGRPWCVRRRRGDRGWGLKAFRSRQCRVRRAQAHRCGDRGTRYHPAASVIARRSGVPGDAVVSVMAARGSCTRQ